MDLNQFPQELSILGTELTAFLECLNDFPESIDDVVESSISVLVAELKVSGQMYAPKVYLHSCTVQGIVLEGTSRLVL